MEGVEAVDLGQTSDARMLSRAGSVVGALAGVFAWSRGVAGAEVVMARNLEMLVLAWVARSIAAPRSILAYEVLDVHRLMLGAGLVSRALRWLERRLLRATSKLVVSSPAFLTGYFEAFGQPLPAVVLLENKVPSLDGPPARPGPRPPGPPWRIAWCGIIRCQRSLDTLAALAAHAPGLVEIEIRGRPWREAFRDFDAQVAASPGVSFLGPYVPDDLPRLLCRGALCLGDRLLRTGSELSLAAALSPL